MSHFTNIFQYLNVNSCTYLSIYGYILHWLELPQILFIYKLNSVLSKILDYSIQGFVMLYSLILYFQYFALRCSDCKLLKCTVCSYKLKSVHMKCSLAQEMLYIFNRSETQISVQHNQSVMNQLLSQIFTNPPTVWANVGNWNLHPVLKEYW
jgi:hypothetical protein